MKLVRTRSRHGADLDGLSPDRTGLRVYLGGVVRELGRLERPTLSAAAGEAALILGVSAGICAYLLGADRLIGAALGLIF